MKIKSTSLLLALLLNIFFVNSVYSENITQDNVAIDSSIETPTTTFDCNGCYCQCDVSNSYRYVSLGTGPILLIPNIGLGYRTRYYKTGWDTAISFSTVGYVHQLSGHFVGHYYLSPCRINSAYLGLGLLGSGIFTNCGRATGTLSPDFVIGKELERTDNCGHFIEMHLAIPTLTISSGHSNGMYLPLMYIKYGMAF